MIWAIGTTGASVLLLLLVIRLWYKQQRKSAELHTKVDQAIRKVNDERRTRRAAPTRHRLN